MAGPQAALGAVSAVLLFTLSPFIASASGAPDDVLASKGLSKVSNVYLIPDDAKLADHMRQIRKAEAGLKAYMDKRRDLEREIGKAEQSIVRWGREMLAINDLMNRESNNVKLYNERVGEIKRREASIREAEQFVARRRETLGKMVAPGDLVTATEQTLTVLEAAVAQYAKLAADKEVVEALAKLNDAGPVKVKLGPSMRLTEELARLQRLRSVQKASVIRMEISGGVPHVGVTINNKVTIPMVVDSGASLVMLTSDAADKLEMRPGPNDPELTLVVADGKQIKARQMKLGSVRVGQFTAIDVVCAVLPREVKDADACLLGGTFLKNFIYRMDLATRELHLAPLGADVVTIAPSAGSASSAGTIAEAPPADPAAAAKAALDAYDADREKALKALDAAKSAAVKAKDVATVEQIEQAITRLSTSAAAMPTGTWRVVYGNGIDRRIRFTDAGTVEWEQSGKKYSGGRVSRRGNDILLELEADRIDRVTMLGDRLFIEHFTPASSYPASRPYTLGMGLRE